MRHAWSREQGKFAPPQAISHFNDHFLLDNMGDMGIEERPCYLQRIKGDSHGGPLRSQLDRRSQGPIQGVIDHLA